MIHNEKPMPQALVKSNRLRANFRPKPETFDASQAAWQEKVRQWTTTHPWSVIGAVLGAAGVLGYSLGVRS